MVYYISQIKVWGSKSAKGCVAKDAKDAKVFFGAKASPPFPHLVGLVLWSPPFLGAGGCRLSPILRHNKRYLFGNDSNISHGLGMSFP